MTTTAVPTIEPAVRAEIEQRLARLASDDLSDSIRVRIDDLVALKAATREAGMIDRQTELAALIAGELEHAEQVPDRQAEDTFAREADRLFLDLAGV